MTDSPVQALGPNANGDTSRGRSGLTRASRLAGGAVVSAWVLSVAYHVVLFTIMYLIPWLSDLVNRPPDAPEPFTAIVGDPDQPTVTLAPSNPIETQRPDDEMASLQFAPDMTAASLAISPTTKPTTRVLGIGTGGGDLDRFGIGVSTLDAGPSFFGLGGEARGARRIVYVVDRSGSMLTTLDGVKRELVESIGKLRRTQKFHVVFFNAGAPLENPPRRLVSAIQGHKRDLFRFLEQIVAGGSTDPRPAMRRAFAVEPDLVYFLTDGEFDPNLVDLLDVLNRHRRVRIYTIAYVSRSGSALLERIAREHNGQFRFVSENEIF